MVPVPVVELAKRYYTDCDVYGNCYYNSAWYSWGRWIVVGIIILTALFFILSCGCLARRRRRCGAQPFYGTGWMAPQGKYGDNHQMNNYQQGYNQPSYPQQGYGGFANPPPAYGQQQPQYTGQTFNANDGYYGNPQYQQNGVQQPPQVHQRDTFAPRPGPPPAKA